MWKNDFHLVIKILKINIDAKHEHDKIIVGVRTRSDVEGCRNSITNITQWWFNAPVNKIKSPIAMVGLFDEYEIHPKLI